MCNFFCIFWYCIPARDWANQGIFQSGLYQLVPEQGSKSCPNSGSFSITLFFHFSNNYKYDDNSRPELKGYSRFCCHWLVSSFTSQWFSIQRHQIFFSPNLIQLPDQICVLEQGTSNGHFQDWWCYIWEGTAGGHPRIWIKSSSTKLALCYGCWSNHGHAWI